MKNADELPEKAVHDSFLDAIANFVGVIIILLVLIGAKEARDKVKESAPSTPPVAAVEPTKVETPPVKTLSPEELAEARAVAFKSKHQVEEIATRLVRMRDEAAQIDDARVTLAMHRSIVEEDIARRRAELDADKQKEFDVQRRIAESQMKLDQLTQQQIGLLSGPETIEELESVPTPLAREEDGDAIHLRLKNGHVSIVPFKELIAEVEQHGQDIGRRLQTSEEVVETFGPIDGYRLRFAISRIDDPASLGGPRAGQLRRPTIDYGFEILPTSESIGQDVELALVPGGSLYRHLQSRHRQSPVVVVWLYNDSFDDFRLLKRTLWEMGFSVATKPLPLGAPIAASPHGSKAAVQ